jgi:aminoglycoside phosphotransferase (APT) family kinase protein
LPGVRRVSSGVGLVQARLKRSWDGRRRLNEAEDLLPAVLEQVSAQSGLIEAAGWVLHSAQLSGTQIVVLKVGPPGGESAAVVKMPATDDGAASQARETRNLAALAAEDSLGEVIRLIPERLGAGEVAGRVFTAERLVPGVEGRDRLADPGSRAAVMQAAASAIGELHRCTSAPAQVDGELLDRWIDDRVRILAGAAQSPPALERLAALLRRGWEGRSVAVGWVHGDFWPGNVIFDPDTLSVRGIIDWEWAGPRELPAHDVCYLVIQARMLATGRELGAVIRALVEGAPWEPAERKLLEEGGVLEPGQERVERELLLLVWLRHVASNLIQSPGDARNWIWTSRNVDEVLALV